MPKVTKYLFLILPVIWMALVPTNIHTTWTIASTVEKLKLMQLAVDRFKQTYRRLPESSSEIRSFLLSMGIDFHPYDAFGMRIQYMPLSESEYFVKSFGSDQMINSPDGERDLTLVKMKALQRIPAGQTDLGDRLMHLFPGILLEGNRPPEKPYFARIVAEEITHTKKLIVRGIRDGNFIISSFHDSVEEFLWLGDGKTIVFSANGSSRYQDGIYIWDIESNSTSNILGKLQDKYFPDGNGKFYFSLSKSRLKNNKVYFFAKPMMQAALDPAEFYTNPYFFELVLGEQSFTINNFKRPQSLFEFKVNPMDQIKVSPLALDIQKDWKTLKVAGDITETIQEWQSFCAKYASSPTFPYCLFWLSSLYADAATVLQENHPRESKIMINYAREAAQLLDQQVNAPEYLRSFGYHLMTESESPLPGYSVSLFQAPERTPRHRFLES